jgi:hypothetical protein
MTRTIAELARHCEQEQEQFRTNGTKELPHCIALFRAAFDGNDEAWLAVWHIYASQMRAWVRKYLNTTAVPSESLQEIEIDEILNIALLKFWRAIPNYPDLHTTNQTGLILSFLKQQIIWQAQQQVRAMCQQRPEDSLDSPLGKEHISDEDVDQELLQAETRAEQKALLQQLGARVKHLLPAEDDWFVFEHCIALGKKPRHVLALRPDLFNHDIKQLYNVRKRVARSLLNDQEIQRIRDEWERQKSESDAFLKIRVGEDEESETRMETDPTPCLLNEEVLLDYALESASEEVQAAVEQSPACLAKARHLKRELVSLQRVCYRMTCPDATTLVAYQHGRITGTAQLVIHAHLSVCPLCQHEVALLALMDTTATTTTRSPWRQVVDAVFQPPLAHALRGSRMRHYQTTHDPPLAINLNTSQRAARGQQPSSWTIRGEIRTSDGAKLANALQAATMYRSDHPDPSPYQGTVQADGSFAIAGLPDGVFDLHLLTIREEAEEEIVVHRVVIGDEEGMAM